MRPLAVVLSNDNQNIGFARTVSAVRQAGFTRVFIQWYDDPALVPDQRQQLAAARAAGLEVLFAHLGYQRINDLWLPGASGDEQTERYLQDLEDLHAAGVAAAMGHLCGKADPPRYNETGLKRIRAVCAKARGLGIALSFENTRTPGYLEYVLSHDDYPGVCFDAGHCHAHFQDQFPFAQFAGRIDMVHLHDNHGNHQDEHLLPLDGTVPWDWVVRQLKQAGYAGPLTLEVVYHGPYTALSPEEFYGLAYRRGEQLAAMWEAA